MLITRTTVINYRKDFFTGRLRILVIYKKTETNTKFLTHDQRRMLATLTPNENLAD